MEEERNQLEKMYQELNEEDIDTKKWNKELVPKVILLEGEDIGTLVSTAPIAQPLLSLMLLYVKLDFASSQPVAFPLLSEGILKYNLKFLLAPIESPWPSKVASPEIT